MKEQPSNLLGVLQTIYKWRKTIRNVCLIALVGSLGISLLLDNYYKSSTIFYPASPQLANPELLFGYTSQVTQYYGGDSDMDRLMEIALGKELTDFMIQKFDLYKHYDIDSTKTKAAFKVREHFADLYDVQKNKYDAIEISVEDKDRERAQLMVNAARKKVDEIAQRLTKDAQKNILDAFMDNIDRKKTELRVLDDSIQVLKSKYNVYDINSQGNQLSTLITESQAMAAKLRAKLRVLKDDPSIPRDTITYLRAELQGFEQQYRSLTTGDGEGDNFTMKSFNEGSPQISVLQDLHYQARKQLSYDLERYNQILSAYNTNIPAMHIIEKGELPVIKSRPKRSILVLVSVVAALLFSILGVLLAEMYRDINWQRIKESDAG